MCLLLSTELKGLGFLYFLSMLKWDNSGIERLDWTTASGLELLPVNQPPPTLSYCSIKIFCLSRGDSRLKA